MNKDKLEKLREKYKAFQSGNLDPLELKKELTEAMEKELDRKTVEELADMLLDIILSIEEDSMQDDFLLEDEKGKRKRYTGKYKSSRRGQG